MFTSETLDSARALVSRSFEAADADSNDAEIEALQDARDALGDLIEAAERATHQASEITIGIWISDLDGVPVVQINAPITAGRFRINVNDAPIWDQDSESLFTPPSDHTDLPIAAASKETTA